MVQETLKLEKALEAGLDINVHSNAIDKEDCWTILSCAIADIVYENLKKREGDSYAEQIVRFFLEHGYDVHANDEGNGISVLSPLTYSASRDKSSVEAVKLLLDAGTRTDVQMLEDEYEDCSFYSIV